MNRQTLTYLRLSESMYEKPAQGVLDRILGHVAYYCKENDLPILTCIVVAQVTGLPGRDIPMSRKQLNAERERVYAENWYDIHPPSSRALRVAYEINTYVSKPNNALKRARQKDANAS